MDDAPLQLELEVFLGVFSADLDTSVAAEIDAFVLIINEEFLLDFSVVHDGASDLGVGFFTARQGQGEQSQQAKKTDVFYYDVDWCIPLYLMVQGGPGCQRCVFPGGGNRRRYG